jgi:hypothetical protein
MRPRSAPAAGITRLCRIAFAPVARTISLRLLVCAIGRCRDRGRRRVKNNVEQFL